jgi:arginine/lysine/ornithine decarboxylase
MALTLREGYFAPSRPVPLRAAALCVSAESVIPYPPGVPALLPGEVIDTDMLEYLQALARDGARFVGVEDSTLTSLRVLQELDTGSPLRHIAAPGP